MERSAVTVDSGLVPVLRLPPLKALYCLAMIIAALVNQLLYVQEQMSSLPSDNQGGTPTPAPNPLVGLDTETKLARLNAYQPYLRAASHGFLDIIVSMTERFDGDVDEPNLHGRTALHFAASGGHSDVVAFLLSRDANPSSASLDGAIPLILAAEKGHLNVTKMLTRGNTVDHQTSDGITPLMIASANGHLPIVQYLVVVGGADVNIADNKQMTALAHARRGRHKAVVDYLVDQGAGRCWKSQPPTTSQVEGTGDASTIAIATG